MLKVRPITKKDLLAEHSTSIKAVITSDSEEQSIEATKNPDVVSRSPYAPTSIDPDMVDCSQFNKSTHIDLAIPVANVFLCGQGLDAISKLCNIKDEINCSLLASGKAILERLGPNTVKMVSPNVIKPYEVYNPHNHLIGGNAITYLLENVDIEDRISKLLLESIYKYIPTKYKKDVDKHSYALIQKGGGDVWVIGDYYIVSTNHDMIDDIIGSMDKVRDDLLIGDGKGLFLPPITVMMSFSENPSLFMDMVQNIIPILPYGYRPSIDRQKDPLSILYNRVVKSNGDLNILLLTPGAKLGTIRIAYSTFYRDYLGLTVTKANYDSDNFKPLVDILIGKEGVIRNNVQSATIDFSGRAVITVDPFMSVDTVGIPEDMALNLCQLDAISEFKHNSKNKAAALEFKFREAMVKKAKAILSQLRIIIGRQPTLMVLGIQSFKVQVVSGSSIRLNPLITSAFNADFDGDQMHGSVPISDEAKREAATILANVNNVFLPRDGSCHIAPRHEMIYGLYKCYKAKATVLSRTITYKDRADFNSNVFEDLKNQRAIITDKCIIGSKEYPTFGYACLKALMGNEQMQSIRLGVIPISTDKDIPESCVTEGWYKELFKHVKLDHGTDRFVDIVNNFVRLGFTVANLYPPDISILKNVDTSDIKKKFDEEIASREEWYNIGFDTEASFSSFYADKYKDMESAILKRVKETLGENNGFIDLVESGARGSKSNLLQLFGMKGTILKNSSESFNAVIKTPLAQSLSGLEHWVSSYGSREGVIDKVIGTFAPGYLSRQMGQVERHTVIVSEDCKTTDGLHFTYSILKYMYGADKLSGRPNADYFIIKAYACKILESRFIVGGGNSPMSLTEAENVFSTRIAKLDLDNDTVQEFDGVKLRSPLTCKDQCCVKCYGTDMMTNRTVVIGTPVGYIGYQSIGEPVTQLIMQNFKKGGVAGAKNLTSSFDVITDLLELYSVSKRENSDEPITHDYISPVSGFIKLVSRGDGTARLNIINDEGKDALKEVIYVYEAIGFKEYVERGDSIQKELGELDVNEILKYRSVYEAQMFILFNAYNIFVNEVFVNFKHFELLVSGMTLYMCTKGNDNFKVGNYYTMQEYFKGDKDGCKFKQVVRGLKQVPKVKEDFLSSLYLEDVNRTVTRNIVTSGKDSLKDPFVRITLGLTPNLGSAYPDYIEQRGV